jgi:predicted cytidylate kinase
MKGKISLAGDLGSGKSTVSKLLIEAPQADYYCTGSIVRQIADRMGMTVVQLNKYMESHPEIDTEIDDGLKALSKDPRLLIIDSRMAWHFTEGSFKVYLSTDIETGAIRILYANRNGEHCANLEDTVRDTRERRLSEQKRYFDSYGVDIKDLSNYDLIVDTTQVTPKTVADIIIFSFERWQEDNSFKMCYLSPERLGYPDDEPDMDKLNFYLSALDEGQRIPELMVCERDGEFFALSEPEIALAYIMNCTELLPCKLVKGEVDSKNYIRMKNSL